MRPPRHIRFGPYRFAVEAVSEPAPDKGQDRFLVTDGFAGVADGSTPLRGAGPIDAGDFAASVLKHLAAESDDPLPQSLRRTIRMLADDDQGAIADQATCTVAAIRAQAGEHALQLLVLGDCLVTIATSTATLSMSDNRLVAYDEPVAQRIAALVRTGLSFEDAREHENAALIANRLQANTPGAYWLVARDEQAAGEACVDTVPAEGIDAALVCTDGFTRLIHPFGVARNASELLELAGRHGMAALLQDLRRRERQPGSIETHPRLDVSDDVAAVLLKRER